LELPRLSASLVLLTAAVGLASCGGSSGTPAASSLPERVSHKKSSSNYIQHIVVIIQENRSFDDLFATFPGANGATQGLMKQQSGGDIYVQLQKVKLKEGCDFPHGYLGGFQKQLDGGKMDGFGLGGGLCHGNTTAAYQYVDPEMITPYWFMAENYVLGDAMFQTQGSGSFTAHQDLIAGATIINKAKTTSIVDTPTHTPWGCDAPHGTKTSVLKYIGSTLQLFHNGPYPCLTYETLRDLLDANSVSWKYYTPSIQKGSEGRLWNAFEAIKAVREGSEWNQNISSPETNIFGDITNGQLAAVSWVVPDRQNSDHPAGPGGDTGPSWVASVVNAVGESQYWSNSAIIVVWDDWGGFYDHVPPPLTDHWGGLGFRVPFLLVSPYAREAYPSQPGYISHTPYEFGSILKFIEQTFNLGSLGTTDARATSISDSFDFTQQARTFLQVPSSHSKSFFQHQKPSGAPVDDE